jgi:hypothetical protein
MLSDAERRRLTEIERGLRSEDPEFAERFGHVGPRGPHKWPGMTARGWLITAALIMGLAVLTANVGTALIALSVAGVSVAWWLTDHTRSKGGGRPTRP